MLKLQGYKIFVGSIKDKGYYIWTNSHLHSLNENFQAGGITNCQNVMIENTKTKLVNDDNFSGWMAVIRLPWLWRHLTTSLTGLHLD